MSDPFDIPKCSDCGKDVFPPEKLIALKKPFHKWCLKCATCKVSLTMKTLESFNNVPYCRAHMQVAKMGGGTQDMRVAFGSGEVASAATKVSGNNQSTENKPQASQITYEKRESNQSTENRPQASQITYEKRDSNQSTENAPAPSAFAEQRAAAPRPVPTGQVKAFNPTPAAAPAAARAPVVARSAPAAAPAPAPVVKKAAPPPEPEPEPQYEEPAAQEEWSEPAEPEPAYQEPEQTYEEPAATEEFAEQFAALSIGSQVMAVYSGDGNQYEATVDEVADGQYLVNYGAAFNNETEWLPATSVTAL